MPKLERRQVRRFIYEADGGYILDIDSDLPSITTAQRERHCRGAYKDTDGNLVYCHRIISRKIPTLQIDGMTAFRKSNPHYYCPRCANFLLQEMKRKLENELEVMKKVEESKKNQKDIKKSNLKWTWEKVFH